MSLRRTSPIRGRRAKRPPSAALPSRTVPAPAAKAGVAAGKAVRAPVPGRRVAIPAAAAAPVTVTVTVIGRKADAARQKSGQETGGAAVAVKPVFPRRSAAHSSPRIAVGRKAAGVPSGNHGESPLKPADHDFPRHDLSRVSVHAAGPDAAPTHSTVGAAKSSPDSSADGPVYGSVDSSADSSADGSTGAAGVAAVCGATPPQADADVRLMLDFQRTGDPDAFASLVDRNQAKVYSVIYRFVADRVEAEDLTQEVFLRVYRTAARYTPTAKFSTWLYRIAVNVSLNALRSRSRTRTVPLALPSDTESGDDLPRAVEDTRGDRPNRGVESDELKTRIAEAIDNLPENQRIAIVLNKFEGLSYEEIGKILSLSMMAVKSLLSRARGNLKDSLDRYVVG